MAETLRDQLLSAAEDMHALVKQVRAALPNFQQKGAKLELPKTFNDECEETMKELTTMLETVERQQEQTALIEQLEQLVDERNQIIFSVEDQLRRAQDNLHESVFQGKCFLEKLAVARTKGVLSEEAIEFSARLAKSHSLAAPSTWNAGDSSRPFPSQREISSGIFGKS
ncbi:unnamed protein product, partial [Mesorhabditis spiculigera]